MSFSVNALGEPGGCRWIEWSDRNDAQFRAVGVLPAADTVRLIHDQVGRIGYTVVVTNGDSLFSTTMKKCAICWKAMAETSGVGTAKASVPCLWSMPIPEWGRLQTPE